MPPRAVDAVIFDLDGLLIDSEPLWWASEIEVFAGVGLHLDEADCARTTGLRIDEVVALRYGEQPWPASAGTQAEVTDRVVAAVIDRIGRQGRALPGAVRAVEESARRGLRVGLASSSSRAIILAATARLGLGQRFDAVCSAEGLPLGKPHPAVYLDAAAALAVPPTRCLAVEDSINGVIAAKAARMRCLAVPDVPQRGRREFGIADAVLDSLDELDDARWERLLA